MRFSLANSSSGVSGSRVSSSRVSSRRVSSGRVSGGWGYVSAAGSLAISRAGSLALLCTLAACSSDDPKTSTVIDPVLGADGNGSGRPSPMPDQPRDNDPGASGLVGLVDGQEQPPACSDQVAPAAARPPLIQFVVDTSGSMSWVPGTSRTPRSGEQSKWQITQRALATAIAAMPDDIAVGLAYFPNLRQGDAQCFRAEVAAPLAPLTAEQRALINQVNDAESPFGGTPMHGAYNFGVEQLKATTLDGPRFLLLITDGIPTYTLACDGDGKARVDGAPLIQDVQARFEDSQIRTFVIGSPGSEEARDDLSKMASVGGTASPGCAIGGPAFCHFDMTAEPDFSKALNQALAQITQATLACDYAVPKPPGGLRIDFNDASVVLESGGTNVREFERSASGECAEGWQFGADRTSLHLCPATCSELQGLLQRDPTLEVSIKFGCSTSPR